MSFINKSYSTHNIIIDLCREIDDKNELVCQWGSLCVKGVNFHDEHIINKEPISFGPGEYLTHVTLKENVADILSNGIFPAIGNIYAGYWLHEAKDEFANTLHQGIFLMRNGTFHTYMGGYKTLYIDPCCLDMDYLYVDHAWQNQKSLFYTKEIPPQCISLQRYRD